MLIKVQFVCDETFLSSVCDGLREIAGSANVTVEPQWAYSNFCGMYRGDMSVIESMNTLLCNYYMEGLVTYYEIGHIGGY